jgi:hypothetical protein
VDTTIDEKPQQSAYPHDKEDAAGDIGAPSTFKEVIKLQIRLVSVTVRHGSAA